MVMMPHRRKSVDGHSAGDTFALQSEQDGQPLQQTQKLMRSANNLDLIVLNPRSAGHKSDSEDVLVILLSDARERVGRGRRRGGHTEAGRDGVDAETAAERRWRGREGAEADCA